MIDPDATRVLPIADVSGSSCACCSPASAELPAVSATDAVTRTYLVEGMTCSHCVASVTEELGTLPGVESVAVELAAGAASRVTVASGEPLALEKVREAVGEAGYRLVDA